MNRNQLRILNIVLLIVFILVNIITEQLYDWVFYRDISIICLMFGIIEVYLHELNDEG